MSITIRDVPIGTKVLQWLFNKICPRLRLNRDLCYRSSILILTYLAYMSYHLSRKPISVVKNVLHQNCQNITPPAYVPPNHLNNWCDWAPFDGTDNDAAHLLGTLDSAFLFSYAISMFISGYIAERINLRYFLSLGMIFSGVFSYLFGIARAYNIHSLNYFILVQALAGVVQTTGWPGVVTIVSNWFGKSKRGLLFGVWNSHTSIGNILGSVIAGEYVEKDWGLSFIIPGLIIATAGFAMWLFLVTSPKDVGCTVPDHEENESRRPSRRIEPRNIQYGGHGHSDADDVSSETDDTEIIIGEQEVQRRVTERTPILRDVVGSTAPANTQAIGIVGALKIPGVIEFSLSLFFAKLVSYTFIYWLPHYINASTTLGAKFSADVSTLFDFGGIAGAILAGVMADQSGMPACTCAAMLLVAAPTMFVYQSLGSSNLVTNMFLLIIVGVLVNGPYALITTAVSAELGTSSSLEGNQKALATVTAIIDGTGSIGAAVGPLLAGFMSSYGWASVFYMLIISDLISMVILFRLVKQEIARFKQSRRTV